MLNSPFNNTDFLRRTDAIADTLDLPLDNLYANGYLVVYSDGPAILKRERLGYIPTPRDINHEVVDGDRIDMLAFRYYGNSKYWWAIADINRVLNPFQLEVGSILVIPDINLIQSIIGS